MATTLRRPRSAATPAAVPVATDPSRRATGLIALLTAVAGTLAFLVLIAVFEFPDVLDRGAAEVLPLFADNQAVVVSSYLVLTMTGIGFAALAVGVDRLASGPRNAFLPAITVVGVLAGLAQTIGFARWPFLVPVLSDAWADPATGDATRASLATTYEAFNAYAGGAIGEHLGWVLQSAWGIGAAVALRRAGLIGSTMATSGILLAAGFGALTYAGLFGSGADAIQGPLYTVWVLWVAVMGFGLLRSRR